VAHGAYVAFGGMNMFEAVGRDNYDDGVTEGIHGFLNNARWHHKAPWGDRSLQWIADNWKGVPIEKICTTAFTPTGRWKKEAEQRIRNSSCLVALLARDPRVPPEDPRIAPFVRWEMGQAVKYDMPMYVMRRTNANWMTDKEVNRFLKRALEEAPRDGSHDVPIYSYVDERGRETYEGWDGQKWAYPGLSRFLDDNC